MEGFVKVPGGRLWYEVRGEDTEGIPLLTIHGGPGVPHNYLETLEMLENERPLVFYDQLGCGKSDRPSDKSLWRIERFVEEIELLRSELGYSEIHLLGQSWGTILACEYALKYPETVKSMVLSGPAMSISRFESDARRLMETLSARSRETINRAEKSGNFIQEGYQEAMSEFYVKFVCRMEPWPECVNEAVAGMGEDVYNYMYGPSEFTVTGVLKGYYCSSRLGEINSPVLLTCGQHDEATSFYIEKFPNGVMRVFEESSHEHHLEKPLEYIQEVRQFLTRAESKS
jgi:proline iminopeptidase